MHTSLLLLLTGCIKGNVNNDSDDHALSFSGAGCVDVVIDASWFGPPITIEAWIQGNPDEASGHQPVLVWPGAAVLAELDDGTAWFGDVDLTAGTTWNGGLMDGAWHHVAGTVNAEGRMDLYVDGERRSFATLPDPTAANDLTLGCWRGQDAWLSGVIDEVRLSVTRRYDGDFTPQVEPFEADDDTITLWHLDEGEGTLTLDAASRADGLLNDEVEWVVSDRLESP
ncbi:MAG: LamG domain-containing protein [Alphaproteobacteria bacterium]|nr:LamG domain-containing protein [Alphaproteobacteria bacterium]